jgi:hypothetical protein
MVRSASALLAVLILSGFVVVQQVATHTVVRGDTLWDLAQHYYNDPFQWRRIWEANRDKIADPNLIYPDQVFAIPGREASVSGVAVEAAPVEAPAQAAPQPEPGMQPPAPPPGSSAANLPTIFRSDTAVMRAGVLRTEGAVRVAVPAGMVMSAPWVVRLGEEPQQLGEIKDFAGGAIRSQTARQYNRVEIDFAGTPPPAGTQLQAFHQQKVIETVGRVMIPTGIVTVSEVEGNKAVAVVSHELDRLTLGDYVRPLPEYTLRPGQEAEPVSGGAEAMIMGFAGPGVLHDVEGIAFLDQGSDDGVNIGDEYEYLNRDAGADVVEGRLQVVGLTPGMAAARILSMDDAVFHQGIVVRLARKMR